MAEQNVSLAWTGEGLKFNGGSPDGTRMPIDGDGGSGPSPVQMLALALGGCMAVDVLDITRKSRVAITGLEVDIAYERREEPPRRITAVRHVFRTTGVAPADEPKVRRAIELSRETYCSVLHSLREDIEMSFELELR